MHSLRGGERPCRRPGLALRPRTRSTVVAKAKAPQPIGCRSSVSAPMNARKHHFRPKIPQKVLPLWTAETDDRRPTPPYPEEDAYPEVTRVQAGASCAKRGQLLALGEGWGRGGMAGRLSVLGRGRRRRAGGGAAAEPYWRRAQRPPVNVSGAPRRENPPLGEPRTRAAPRSPADAELRVVDLAGGGDFAGARQRSWREGDVAVVLLNEDAQRSITTSSLRPSSTADIRRSRRRSSAARSGARSLAPRRLRHAPALRQTVANSTRRILARHEGAPSIARAGSIFERDF